MLSRVYKVISPCALRWLACVEEVSFIAMIYLFCSLVASCNQRFNMIRRVNASHTSKWVSALVHRR
jgi:hypothetical protein